MSVSSVAVSSTCKHPSVNCQVCEVETGNGISCCLELKARMQCINAETGVRYRGQRLLGKHQTHTVDRLVTMSHYTAKISKENQTYLQHTFE